MSGVLSDRINWIQFVGELIKGISGGQRKRTSIGIEIITDPVLLFLVSFI